MIDRTAHWRHILDEYREGYDPTLPYWQHRRLSEKSGRRYDWLATLIDRGWIIVNGQRRGCVVRHGDPHFYTIAAAAREEGIV